MIDIGRFNSLEVLETRSNGLLLDAGQALTLLLPIEQVSRDYPRGEEIDVFIYLTADGQPAATITPPLAEVGQVAWLEIVDVNDLGAFAHWGLPKDLFIPFAEQQHPLHKRRYALVWIYLDNQGRIAGSTRVDHWIKDNATGLEVGQEVALVIADQTELGLKAVVNHQSWGLLYDNELFRKLNKGERVTGYIKRIRSDNKIDLSLEKPGFSKNRIEIVGDQIIQQLEASDGKLALTDKSPPETIYATFGVSKKVFKQALGALYKQRRITLHADGVKLVKI
jgi:predicted RNA-binding protein (virulence factor B family)